MIVKLYKQHHFLKNNYPIKKYFLNLKIIMVSFNYNKKGAIQYGYKRFEIYTPIYNTFGWVL